jgi:hypothetical protein
MRSPAFRRPKGHGESEDMILKTFVLIAYIIVEQPNPGERSWKA